MQGPHFLYAIKNKMGQSASFSNNALTWNSAFTPLELSPNGWKELSIITERNKNYFAVDINYGTPNDFVKSAAAILQSIAYLKGIEEVVYLQILEQQLWFTDTEYGYYYDQIVKCEIDMSSYVDAGSVNVVMEDGDVIKYLRANESIDYSIDLDVPDRKKILMDGMTILQSASFIIQDSAGVPVSHFGSHIIGLGLISIEQQQQVGAKTTLRIGVDRNPDIVATRDNVLQTYGNTDITIISNFAITVSSLLVNPSTLQYSYIAKIYDQFGNFVREVEMVQTAVGAGIGRHLIQRTDIISNVPDGSVIYLLSISNKFNNEGGILVSYNYDNNDTLPGTPNIIIKYTFRPPQKMVYGFTLKQVFEKLVYKMTDGQYGVSSDLLDNPDLNIMVTCGDGLRKIVGAQIKISMKKFFSLCNLIHGIGMGAVGGKLKIERKKFWCAVADPGVDLGETGARPKIYPATSVMFSNISIGWPNQSAGNNADINGRYEFNVTQKYSTPVTRVSTKLDLTTTARADASGIVYTFLNLEGKTSTSSNSDNDVIVLHVEKNLTVIPSPITGLPILSFYKLDRSINQYIVDNNLYVNAGDVYNGQVVDQAQYVRVGVIDKESVFNAALSPKQCMIRAHGDYIRSCLDGMDNKYLVFSGSDKNSALIINSPVNPTAENENVQIASLAAPLFKPWIYEGMIKNPNGLSLLLTKNPIRKYLTSYNGIPVNGIAQKSAVAPDSNAPQAYQLLLGPDVDLSPFITVYE
jgi:hypothetical protein